MVNEAFTIRVPSSGPDMPASTPGYVLTIQADGTSVKAEPAGGGGAGTPLTLVAYVDAAAAAGGNGFNSLTQAFNTAQDAFDAGYRSLYFAPGTYADLAITGDDNVLLCGLVQPGKQGQNQVLLSSITIAKGGGDVCLQNLSCADVTDTSLVPIVLTLVDASMSGGITGTNTVLRTGTETETQSAGFRPNVISGDVACAAADLSYTLITGTLGCSTLSAQFCSIGAATASGAATLRNCSANGAFTGTALTISDSTVAGALTLTGACDGQDSTLSGAVDITGATTFRNVRALDAFHGHAAGTLAQSSFAGAFQLDGNAAVVRCTFDSAADTTLFLGAGVSAANDSSFAGVVQCNGSLFNLFDCDYAKTITATTGLTLRQCRPTGATPDLQSNALSLDSETERSVLAAGCNISSAIRALSLGQGGRASLLSVTASVDFSAALRAVATRGALGADIVLTINEASGVATEPFFVDCWQSVHTVTVKDSAAATLVVCPAQTAGTGARYTFGISVTTGKAVLITAREAL